MKRTLFLSSGLFFFTLFFCAPPVQKPELPKVAGITLEVSGNPLRDFVPFQKSSYSDTELPILFQSLETAADEYCSMVHQLSPYDPVKAENFIRKERLGAYRANFHKNSLFNLTAGCWNFFTMNDMSPDVDFTLLKKLLPGLSYECYSVGFIQPYIMHNIMNCRSLTMLDLDWRILDGQYQMLSYYRKNLIVSREFLRAILEKLRIGWIALNNTAQPRNTITMDVLCKFYPPDICEKHLMDFQTNFNRLDWIKLYVTALHEAVFPISPAGTIKVIYVSNALEDIYTTQAEFDALLMNIDRSLLPGQRAVIIYHAGGTRVFGLYEIQKRRDSGASVPGPLYTVNTLCKDTYITKAKTDELHSYDTYFESISVTKKIPSCLEMAAQAQKG